MDNKKTSFDKDIEFGKIGERIVLEDFLNHYNIGNKDVSDDKPYQFLDIDFVTDKGTLEVKAQSKGLKYLNIEDFTNCNPELGKISKGWIDKCKAKIIVFVDTQTREMVFFKFKEFKKRYNLIKNQYKPIRGRISTKNVGKWQGQFRQIPLRKFKGTPYFVYNLTNEGGRFEKDKQI